MSRNAVGPAGSAISVPQVELRGITPLIEHRREVIITFVLFDPVRLGFTAQGSIRKRAAFSIAVQVQILFLIGDRTVVRSALDGGDIVIPILSGSFKLPGRALVFIAQGKVCRQR